MIGTNIFATTVAVVVFALLLAISKGSYLQEREVARWTDELGLELWNLGKTITKFSEIQSTYRYLNAQVEKKDPERLLAEMVQDIERMMDRKMDAIMCILQTAERESESFVYNESKTIYQYYSSKYSSLEGEPLVKLPRSLKANRHMYPKMKLNNDTHFYNLPVNTSHSSVHVPTNIYDRHKEAAVAIQWSEALDDVFVQNYNSDPALSWQYFGSSSGIMRHYPAKRWEEAKKDLFDCRIRTWFIEAATCTKDVVILVDNSGSMDGMGRHIGALTAYSILDTFSNNDYINVLNYSSFTNYTIPCFEGMLVQATKENIRVFKTAIQALKPVGKTKLDQAFEVAFKLLASYREKRGCSENSRYCNQAVMVITDGVSKNMSDVVQKYNYLNGGKTIPVRIFTYLIGQEVTNVKETMWMSCENRGYYTHVQSLEQVTASVLEYIKVIARPLVLQGVEHPASWTHAYIDLTYDDENDDQINEPYRLLTSVAVPAFDTKANQNNETRMADLLGVAATDVPIEEIEKLTIPYKIGVNGYAFIVSNNGYVLMHPDLRPVFEGRLTDNYNSIDLTEVEQIDNDLPPHELDEILLNLRLALVSGSQGSLHNVSIKYHYDEMRRVSREVYDYYFAPLKNTPFSIGLAIPNPYGNYSLDVGDEISKNRHTGTKITDFFAGTNWKIHPKWVYCRYHYLEGHEFRTPEKELLHFLDKMYDADFKWAKQYEAGSDEENLDQVECGRKTHGDDDYYCDRQLVQRLVFDARNTQHAFSGPWIYQSGELPLFVRFNATLRFVATMSGLTRWEYISPEVENVTKKEFGDWHSRAIDETWYKSAVLQRQYDSDSFVYSVPFGGAYSDRLLVTGSYAIFPSDAGLEAPGSVVGFQFAHANLRARVKELTNKVSNQCRECGTCNTTLECYIIDSSGYIIVSDNANDTGRFFGEVEGDIMDSMLFEDIFERVTVYDFQAICNKNDDGIASNADLLLTPLNILQLTFNWFFMRIAWLSLEFNIFNSWQFLHSLAQELIENTNDTFIDGAMNDDDDDDDDKDEDDDDDDDRYYACEKQRDLFILKQTLFLHNRHPIEISSPRPYYVKKVPYSNLLFVAVNTTMPLLNTIKYSASPQKIIYDNETVYPCQKLGLNNLERRRLAGCFNEDPKEHEIKACGKSANVKINFKLLIALVLLINY